MVLSRSVIRGALIFIVSIVVAFILSWVVGGVVADRIIGTNILVITPPGNLTNNPYWTQMNANPTFMLNIFYAIIYIIPLVGLLFFIQSLFAEQGGDIPDTGGSGGYTRFRRG